eukprot:7274513-Pyramimonas_sp.AAC.1
MGRLLLEGCERACGASPTHVCAPHVSNLTMSRYRRQLIIITSSLDRKGVCENKRQSRNVGEHYRPRTQQRLHHSSVAAQGGAHQRRVPAK